MKISRLFTDAISSIALPLIVYGVDPAEPGKTSDAAKSPPAQSPGANRKLTPDSSPTVNERQFNGRITAVNRDDNTITVNDQTTGSQVLHIGETTKMKRGNTGASWDDLKVGENVQGMMRTDGSRAHASSIEIGK
jgi:hypothetical protein